MPEYLTNTDNNWPTKAMFGALVFLGVATLILGTLQLGKNIGGTSNGVVANSATTGVEETEKTIEQLQTMDTDGDGLTDFDELYVYGTSPYLKDSDSDTFDDNEEIDQGFDPNCPKGQDCRGTANTETNTNSNTNSQTEIEQNLNNGLDTSVGEDTTSRVLTAEEKAALKQLTPAEMRQLLVESGGVTAEQLEGVSDEDLMKAVEEVLGGE